MAARKQKSKKVGAERLRAFLEDIYASRLCDPECEGRCRVCPETELWEILYELELERDRPFGLG